MDCIFLRYNFGQSPLVILKLYHKCLISECEVYHRPKHMYVNGRLPKWIKMELSKKTTHLSTQKNAPLLRPKYWNICIVGKWDNRKQHWGIHNSALRPWYWSAREIHCADFHNGRRSYRMVSERPIGMGLQISRGNNHHHTKWGFDHNRNTHHDNCTFHYSRFEGYSTLLTCYSLGIVKHMIPRCAISTLLNPWPYCNILDFINLNSSFDVYYNYYILYC